MTRTTPATWTDQEVFERQLARAQAKVIDAAAELCRLHVGKDANGEQWGDTLRRLGALDKLVKAVRRLTNQHERGDR